MTGAEPQANPIALLRQIAERSRQNAFGLPQQEDAKEYWHGIAFRAGQTDLLMPLEAVRELLKYPSLSPLPGAKPWVKGIANIRGTLLPIIDLNAFLGGQPTKVERRSRVLVIAARGAMTGLVVDEVLGMKHFLRDSYTDALAQVPDAVANYLSGSYGRDGRLWGVFDLQKLMDSPEFMQVAA